MSCLLRVENLCIEFDTERGRRRVVDDVSFEVNVGEVLGILGESGSGKTLATLAVMGLVDGSPGVVGGRITLYDGANGPVDLLAGLDDVLSKKNGAYRKKNRRWRRIIHRRMAPIWGQVMTPIFQNPRASLDPLVSVGAHVRESVRLAEQTLSKSQAEGRALEWLERVQMNQPERVYQSYPHELSGGMCQRAMIAIALARRPKLLIADEPTTGLDTTVRAEIVELFRRLLAEERRAMLYISHDVREVLYLADRVMVMREGKVLETATSSELQNGEGTRADYTTFLMKASDIEIEARHD